MVTFVVTVSITQQMDYHVRQQGDSGQLIQWTVFNPGTDLFDKRLNWLRQNFFDDLSMHVG